MRLYFDLKDSLYTLQDVDGVEVVDPDRARQVAFAVIRQLREEDSSVAQDWSGWTVRAMDPAGSVVFSIDLDTVT